VITPKRPHSRKLILTAGLITSAILIAAGIFLGTHWPFRRQAVLKDLEEASESRVVAGGFHETYFPRPGCVLDHVIFQHDSDPQPLIAADRIRIEGSFTGLFTSHVTRIVTEGLHIVIPAKSSSEHFKAPKRSTVVIDELTADGGMLEVRRRDSDQPPLQFTFPSFSLSNVGARGPATFRAKFSNPEPPGEIITTGKFGPWNSAHVGKTPVSGEYEFEHADLGTFHGIAGLLSSTGNFSGTINQIEVDGSTDIPQFAVTSSQHTTQLHTQFHATVNAENGDTFLQRVSANFRKTTAWSEGSIAGGTGHPGKDAALDLAVKDGRIQDILLLFVKSPRSPMSGIVSFKAKAVVPSGKLSFIKKVELEGDFGIDAGSFTKPNTQRGVNNLSAGASGKKEKEEEHRKSDQDRKSIDEEADSGTVLSELRGHVRLKAGIANFSNLSFAVPGAVARLNGTYNLESEKIDFHGTLKTHDELSETTHGVKSLMLKVLDPFFKKKPADYEAPIKMTGTYEHPVFGLDFSDRDDKGKKGKDKRQKK
jgi:hypothetical protein